MIFRISLACATHQHWLASQTPATVESWTAMLYTTDKRGNWPEMCAQAVGFSRADAVVNLLKGWRG